MNTVKCYNGAEIYADNIRPLVDEYINSLEADTPEDRNKLMTKSPIFRGMLKYIYTNLFKINPDRGDIKYNNKNSNIDYSDIDYINTLWDIYTSLCYKYLQNPTILNFGLLTGIDFTTFDSWNKGTMRAGPDGASSEHSKSYKRWLKECEAALVDGASTGNPGPMFLLKANYGYVEQAQRIEIVGQGTPQISTEELLRLRQERRELPQKPDLDG